MPFNAKEDVYIISRDDTGEVRTQKADIIYIVSRDADNSEGDHHEEDLRTLPFEARIQHKSFYYIVKATRNGSGRDKKTSAYRNGGGRIR